jgi:septal ring factor EnvC (AmiA/AmiB activator)
MKFLFIIIVFSFLTASTSFGQEKKEILTDSIAMVTAVEDAATLERIKKSEKEVKEVVKMVKKAEKESKQTEKKSKKLEKEIKQVEKLLKSISGSERSIDKNKSKINNLEDKLATGNARGKLSPVDISKLNVKISKKRASLNKEIQKLEKLKRKQ